MSVGIPSVLAQGLIDYGGGSTPSVSPAASSLLLLFIEQWPDPNTAISVSGQADGNGWSVVSDNFVTDSARHVVLAAKSPASPAAGAITITPPGGLRCHYYLVEIVLGGGSWTAATALAQAAFNNGFGTSMGAALPSAPTSATLSFTSWGSNNTGVTYENAQLGTAIEASVGNHYIGMDYASTGDQTPTINRGDSATWRSTSIEIADPVGAANSAPVVNDQTFSVADSASNGTVIGTLVATDSDGTVDSYAISGSTLAINSTTGQITLDDNSGIVAGTPITATATVTDDAGDTDTATVTVNVTNAVLTDTLLDAESSNAAIANETGLSIHVYDTDGGTELYSTASATTDGSGVFVVDDDAIGVIDDTVFVVIKRSNGQTACGTMTVVDGAV